MTTTQKDFIALSHGKEWVSFYESFDKLVQDNLSRSSDLLRRAMSLPEVADREVQQIRTEMEGKLAAERDSQRELLSSLKDELGGSQHLVSTLARSLGAVIGDLERLSQRVETAIDALAAIPVVSNGAPAAAAPEIQAVAAPIAQPSIDVAPIAAPLSAPPAVPAPNFTFQASGEEIVPFDVNELNLAMEEQSDLLDAAEDQMEDLEEAIDLSAMAEAEVADATAPGTGQFAAEATGLGDASAGGETRARPHWLSVTRAGSRT